jgi:serine/threonine protein kinase
MYEKKIPVYSSVLHVYSPKRIEILRERYKTDKLIYHQGLNPTCVYMGVDVLDDSKVAIKQINKGRMERSFSHEMARNELAVHYSLSNNTNCNNIVKAKDYFEDEKAYYLVMECSPEPNYFEDMLENVKFKYLKYS